MIVTVVLVLTVACIAAFVVGLALRSRREFREQNEVVPGVASAAPASWAGAHTPEARMHRRLRDAVAAAHTAADTSPASIAGATERIDAEALALDQRLVAAAALPARHREDAVARLEPLVERLEDTVAALVARLSEPQQSRELLEASLDDADIALEALARAREEVDRLQP